MPASKGSRSSSKKAKKTGSNVFDMFTQKQVAEFKEGFQVMDRDRDGILNKSDLRAIFDEIGRVATDKELEDMLGEAPGPINFTTLLHMFAERNQGGESDDDDVVAKAFRAFEQEPGIIDSENFRTMLMAFGDRFTPKEVDDAFDQMEIDDNGKIDSNMLIGMLTAGAKSEDDA